MNPKIRFAIVQKETGGLQYVDFKTVIGLNLAEGDIRLLDYNNRDFSIRLDMNGNVKYTKGKKYYKFEIKGSICNYIFEMLAEGTVWPLIKSQLELLERKGILEDGS